MQHNQNNMTAPLLHPEKITQLQCDECNRGLQAQFSSWLADSFKYCPALLSLHDEMEAVLGVAEYCCTVARNKPQPGDYLQNLQFQPLSQKQKILWLICSVVLPYLLRKLRSYCSGKESAAWGRVEWALRQAERAATVGEFINYAVFILRGKYRTLTQRLLGIRMKFVDPTNKRVLNFSLMNRMLVWQIYELFLKTVLPGLFSFASGPLKDLFYLSSYLQPDRKSPTACVFCQSEEPVMPHRAAPCDHRACYYCWQKAQVSKCPACSKELQGWLSLLH